MPQLVAGALFPSQQAMIARGLADDDLRFASRAKLQCKVEGVTPHEIIAEAGPSLGSCAIPRRL